MCGLYISQINRAMNKETKAAPSQSAWADGFKSLLQKYTGFQLVPSLASSLSLGNQCRDAGAGSVRSDFTPIPGFLLPQLTLTRLPRVLES